MSNVIKGGRKRTVTNLELRQKLWESMKSDNKGATKRPGSNKK